MLRTSRTSRSGPLRRTLTVEALEERTLLTGVVTANLNPSGLLDITGDTGNNQFTLALSPLSGNLRISGNRGTFTAINGVTFVDFPLADLKDINMTLLNSKGNVTFTGFSISGDLNINYGNAEDVFTLNNFTAAHVNYFFTGTGTGPGPGSGSGSGGSGSGGGNFGGIFGSGNNGGLLFPPGG